MYSSGLVTYFCYLRYFVIENSEQSANAMISKGILYVQSCLINTAFVFPCLWSVLITAKVSAYYYVFIAIVTRRPKQSLVVTVNLL